MRHSCVLCDVPSQQRTTGETSIPGSMSLEQSDDAKAGHERTPSAVLEPDQTLGGLKDQQFTSKVQRGDTLQTLKKRTQVTRTMFAPAPMAINEEEEEEDDDDFSDDDDDNDNQDVAPASSSSADSSHPPSSGAADSSTTASTLPVKSVLGSASSATRNAKFTSKVKMGDTLQTMKKRASVQKNMFKPPPMAITEDLEEEEDDDFESDEDEQDAPSSSSASTAATSSQATDPTTSSTHTRQPSATLEPTKTLGGLKDQQFTRNVKLGDTLASMKKRTVVSNAMFQPAPMAISELAEEEEEEEDSFSDDDEEEATEDQDESVAAGVDTSAPSTDSTTTASVDAAADSKQTDEATTHTRTPSTVLDPKSSLHGLKDQQFTSKVQRGDTLQALKKRPTVTRSIYQPAPLAINEDEEEEESDSDFSDDDDEQDDQADAAQTDAKASSDAPTVTPAATASSSSAGVDEKKETEKSGHERTPSSTLDTNASLGAIKDQQFTQQIKAGDTLAVRKKHTALSNTLFNAPSAGAIEEVLEEEEEEESSDDDL